MINKLKHINDTVKDIRFYINITNGLEALPMMDELGVDINDIRYSCIQSTHLEQNQISLMLSQLGPNLLMDLATGKTCAVIDFGANKTLSRAVYQGVPFIKYTLERIWFGKKPTEVYIQPREFSNQCLDVTKLYEAWYRKIEKKTKRYLKRFKRFASADIDKQQVKIIGVSQSTSNDGCPEFYEQIARDYLT